MNPRETGQRAVNAAFCASLPCSDTHVPCFANQAEATSDISDTLKRCGSIGASKMLEVCANGLHKPCKMQS